VWGYEYEQKKREQRRKIRMKLLLLAILAGVAAWAWFEFLGDFSWADNRLLSAAREGDPAGVEQAVARGANANATDGDGRSALHLAAWRGQMQAARALIRAGANPNARDAQSGETPLHAATRANRPEMVELLLAAGARSSLRTFEQSPPDADGNVHPPGSTAYQMARTAGFEEIVGIFAGDRLENPIQAPD